MEFSSFTNGFKFYRSFGERSPSVPALEPKAKLFMMTITNGKILHDNHYRYSSSADSKAVIPI